MFTGGRVHPRTKCSAAASMMRQKLSIPKEPDFFGSYKWAKAAKEADLAIRFFGC